MRIAALLACVLGASAAEPPETAAPGLPIWTRQMPAFVLAKVGAKEAARDLMEAILEDPNVPPEEQQFMREFIDERLK